MKFIELSELESVSVESIVYFRAVDGGSLIFTEDGNSYSSILSYETIKKLIGMNESKYDDRIRKMEQNINVISKSMTRPTP